MDVLLARCAGSVIDADVTNEFTKMYSLKRKKLSNPGILTSIYWLEGMDKPPKYLECVILHPARNPMITGSSAGKPIAVWHKHQGHKNIIGIPRYLGMSLFGIPADDRRTLGDACAFEFKLSLLPHQVECAKRALAMLQEWGGATMIADCGFGKTATSLYILAQLGRKAAIICNRSVLMEQWKDAISKFLGSTFTISFLQGADSVSDAVKADIMICSIDTLVNGVPRSALASFGTVIVDEMHHLAAASLVHAVPLFPAKYTVGLTATPTRSDGLEHALYWLVGPAACVYQRVPEITGKTGTVEVRKVVFTAGQKKEIVYHNGTLGFSAMISALAEDTVRNELLKGLIVECYQTRNRTVVVTSLVEHAKLLKEGIPHAALMAGASKDRAVAQQARMIFATYSMLEEGYDDPTLDTLILATPRSNVQQTVGRIEREHPGKPRPLVIDIVDDFSLYPNMYWKRHKFYTSRGFEVHT